MFGPLQRRLMTRFLAPLLEIAATSVRRPRWDPSPFHSLPPCWRLPFRVDTKRHKSETPIRASAQHRHRPTLVVDPRSSACLGRHRAVLGHHTCSLGDLGAHPRARPPHLTSFARKATRAATLGSRTPLAVAIATKQPIAYGTHGPSQNAVSYRLHHASCPFKRSSAAKVMTS